MFALLFALSALRVGPVQLPNGDGVMLDRSELAKDTFIVATADHIYFNGEIVTALDQGLVAQEHLGQDVIFPLLIPLSGAGCLDCQVKRPVLAIVDSRLPSETQEQLKTTAAKAGFGQLAVVVSAGDPRVAKLKISNTMNVVIWETPLPEKPDGAGVAAMQQRAEEELLHQQKLDMGMGMELGVQALTMANSEADWAAAKLTWDRSERVRVQGEPTLLGSMKIADASAAIATAEPDLENCAQSAPNSGKVEIKLVIHEDGSVAKTELRKTTMRHGPTEDCMAQALQAVVFSPPPDGTTVILSWPMVVYVEEGL
ncbi:MAG: hypothetical protein ACI9VR_001086 [Cognaticolwellia sp.]|jgi:hypothetical protein